MRTAPDHVLQVDPGHGPERTSANSPNGAYGSEDGRAAGQNGCSSGCSSPPYGAVQGGPITSAAAQIRAEFTRIRYAGTSSTRGSSLASSQRGAATRFRSKAAGELRPRRHVELAEHLAEVIVDGARANEQLHGELAVRCSGRCEVSHPRFLTREVDGGIRRAGPGAFAGRAQLCGGPLGEPVRTHPGEHVMRGAQLLSRVPPPLGPAEPLAVEQVCACQVDGHPALLELADGFQVAGLRVRALSQQRLAAGTQPERPGRGGGERAFGQGFVGGGRGFVIAGPDGGLNQLRQGYLGRIGWV